VATIGSKNEATFTDGSGPSGDICNMDTADGIVSIPNGKTLAFYSDAYITLKAQVKNGVYCPPTSGTSGTALTTGAINTTNLGISKVIPGTGATATTLATGTVEGQRVTVLNEGTNTITFGAASSSHVASSGTGTETMAPGTAADFLWDQTSGYWYRVKVA